VAGIWGGIGGTSLALAALLLWRDREQLLPLLSPTARGLGWGAAGTVVMVAATYGLFPLAIRFCPPLAADADRLYAQFGAPSPLVLFGLLPLIILSEEIVWRGAVQNAVEARGLPAAVGVGVLYGIAHLPAGSWLLAGVAAAAGTYWALLRHVSGGLVAPLLAHLVWDALVLVFLPLNGSAAP
jgi:uncharacterized protein